MKRGERAIGLGLTADDLTKLEDYAENLRNGEKASQSKCNLLHHDQMKPVKLNMENFDKLVVELERCHIDLEDLQKKVFESEVLNYYSLIFLG